jgi:hypothetical protein
MITALIQQVALVLFLAGKDGASYLLKDRNDGPLTFIRINRWHRDGAAIHFIATVMQCGYAMQLDWRLFVIAALVRASVFNVAFNKFAQIKPRGYIGGSAFFDRVFVFIFGRYGAYRQLITFGSLAIIFVYLCYTVRFFM